MSDLKQKIEELNKLITHIDNDQEQFQELFNKCIDHFNNENEVSVKDIKLFDNFLIQALEDINENSNYVSCFINEVSDHLLDKANENSILYHPEVVINTLDQLTSFANDNGISCDYIVQGMTWLSPYDDDTISEAHIKVSKNTFDYFIHVDPLWGFSALKDQDDLIKLIEYNEFEGIDSFKNGIEILSQNIENNYKDPETLGYILNHFINEADSSNSNLKLIDKQISPILYQNTDVVKLIEKPEKLIIRQDKTINSDALKVFINNEAITHESLEKALDQMYTNYLTEILKEVDIEKLPAESVHEILNKYAFDSVYIDEEQAEVISDLLIIFEVDPDLYFDGDSFDKEIKKVLYDKAKTAEMVRNF